MSLGVSMKSLYVDLGGPGSAVSSPVGSSEAPENFDLGAICNLRNQPERLGTG